MTGNFELAKTIILFGVIPVVGYFFKKTNANCANLTSFIQKYTKDIAELKLEIAEKYVRAKEFTELRQDVNKANNSLTEIKIAMGILSQNNKTKGKQIG